MLSDGVKSDEVLVVAVVEAAQDVLAAASVLVVVPVSVAG